MNGPYYIKSYKSRDKMYYYFKASGEMKKSFPRPIRLFGDDDEARNKAIAIFKSWKSGAHERKKRRESRYRASVNRFLRNAFVAAQKRAVKRKIPFEIDWQGILDLLASQNGRCAVTGLKFELRTTIGRARRREPFRPSLDQINAGAGYVPGNCRLVLVAVNLALGAWGDEVFFRIAEAAICERRRTPQTTKMSNALSGRLTADL